MGWSMSIKADKRIAYQDVQAVMNKLAHTEVRPQPWGWSMECDVSNPEGNRLRISGAWFSFKSAESFGERVRLGLEARGYKTAVTKPR